jgi:hypothetical protein
VTRKRHYLVLLLLIINAIIFVFTHDGATHHANQHIFLDVVHSAKESELTKQAIRLPGLV